MKENNLILPEHIYLEHLTMINEVKFSKREIDVIACRLNGRGAGETAQLLSISQNTVETHIYNVQIKIGHAPFVAFFERSNKHPILQGYYLSLLLCVEFTNVLKNVAKLHNPLRISCQIIYRDEDKAQSFFAKHLQKRLELAGFKVFLKTRKTYRLKLSSSHDHNEIHILSKNTIYKEEWNKDFSTEMEKRNDSLSNLYFLPLDTDSELFFSNGEYQKSWVSFSDPQKYYHSIFLLLKKLIPNSNIEGAVQTFLQELELRSSRLAIEQAPQLKLHQRKFEDSKLVTFWKQNVCKFSRMLFFTIGTLIVSSYIFYVFVFQAQKSDVIRSEISLPSESSLLNRPELIREIDDKLRRQTGIQSIALVGMGGAGKTTLARQYAHFKSLPVVWEIISETRESLNASFERIAHALAKTTDAKNNLKSILQIKNLTLKETRLVDFVKGQLRKHSNWLLIYDNVNSFREIQKHFPHDSNIWGKGKVILTTRDANIRNNKKISYVVSVEELTPRQKLNLFTKIIQHEKSSINTSAQLKDIEYFLKQIPSFPLDVSTAAYYLKTTNIPYHKYIEKLTSFEKDFETIQENILCEAGDYTKTRYNIITLSLNEIIKRNPAFEQLLLLLSLVDSQNIPIDVLSMHNHKVEEIDEFIYLLKKYSLVTNEVTTSFQPIPTISLHRSIQEILFIYLRKKLELEKNKQILETISHSIENYMTEVVNDEDIEKMKLMLTHCESFLSHDTLLTNGVRGGILSEIANINYYFEYDDKALNLLEMALGILKTDEVKYQSRLAKTLAYMGATYRQLGNYKKAEDLLAQSLSLFNILPKNHGRLAHALAYRGMVHRNIGKYTKAKDLFEKSLTHYRIQFPKGNMRVAWVMGHLGLVDLFLGKNESAEELLKQSLELYKKRFSENHIGTAQIKGYLALVYQDRGDLEKARELLEQCSIAYREHFAGTRDDPWSVSNLGDVYRELGDDKKAEKFLILGIRMYNKYFPGKHKSIAFTMNSLGKLYTKTGEYKRAKDLLEKSLAIYEESSGRLDVETAKALIALGELYLQMERLDNAQVHLQKALDIFHKANHGEIYLAWEAIANLNIRKSIRAAIRKDFSQSTAFKAQAISALKKAFTYARSHLSTRTPHIIRIQSKLENIEKGNADGNTSFTPKL